MKLLLCSFSSMQHSYILLHKPHTYCVCVCVCRTLEQAASVPVVYATAYYSLVVRGRLRPGETVLIHSGSGGVGQAAIAIALSKKCRVFTTVGEYVTLAHRLTVTTSNSYYRFF